MLDRIRKWKKNRKTKKILKNLVKHTKSQKDLSQAIQDKVNENFWSLLE